MAASIENLRKEIIEKTAEYYRLVHKTKQNEPFVPGKSRVNYAGRVFDEKEMQNLVDASLEFWLTYGHWSRDFEKGLAAYLGVRWALLVNSGSSANLLAFATLTSPLLGERQVKRGDEVITVAAGFPTTIAPIVQYGAVPVFVDVELDTANIDASKLEAAVSPKTKAVMLAHTLGNPFNIKAVKAFCDKHNLWLIEDNCDALGSKYDDKFTGTWGDIGTSSFYPPHHMTMGEGGAVYTDNPLLKKIALSIRDWGRDCWCESGVDNTCGCRFTKQFGTLPVGYDEISIFRPYPESDPSWFGFLMTVKPDAGFTRNDLAKHLEAANIQTRNLFAGNITKHPCCESLKEGVDYRVAGSLVNTDIIMNSSLWIGLYPGMGDAKIDYMVETIRQFCLAV